eukprot:13781394-Ditylum_brightwellii.AAC.1
MDIPCKTDMKKQSGVAISGMTKYVHTVLSPLDMEVITSFKDEMFISHLCDGHTSVISLAGLVAGCGDPSLTPDGSKSFSIVLIPTQIHVDYGD